VVHNRIYDTWPAAVHAPGKLEQSPWWEPIRRRVFAAPTPKSSAATLAIVTWNSGAANPLFVRSGHTLGWFERSVARWGLPCTVLGRELGAAWSNRMKLDLTLEFLTTTSADVVLGADSSDALLIADPAVLVDRFAQQPAGVLFNAEINPWPPETEEIARFEAQAAPAPFCHLNAGLWIGRRAALLEGFMAARRWADRITARPRSDQICWKHAYRELHPLIQIDARCTLFQCLNQVREEIDVEGRRWPRLSWLTRRLPQ
jgi:hypothetical protein